MEILKSRKHVEAVSFSLFFATGEGRGFSFPCDKTGKVQEHDLQPIALMNLAACREEGIVGVLSERDESYFEPAVGRCDCGNKVTLSSSWANVCSRCGAEYNGFGQRLASRSQWGEETGEQGDW